MYPRRMKIYANSLRSSRTSFWAQNPELKTKIKSRLPGLWGTYFWALKSAILGTFFGYPKLVQNSSILKHDLPRVLQNLGYTFLGTLNASFFRHKNSGFLGTPNGSLRPAKRHWILGLRIKQTWRRSLDSIHKRILADCHTPRVHFPGTQYPTLAGVP